MLLLGIHRLMLRRWQRQWQLVRTHSLVLTWPGLVMLLLELRLRLDGHRVALLRLLLLFLLVFGDGSGRLLGRAGRTLALTRGHKGLGLVMAHDILQINIVLHLADTDTKSERGRIIMVPTVGEGGGCGGCGNSVAVGQCQQLFNVEPLHDHRHHLCPLPPRHQLKPLAETTYCRCFTAAAADAVRMAWHLKNEFI